MGMLKSISLKNYKCFKDETTIDIAPLTVLCGVNSSGKSSILKSLLMLKQTAEGKLSEPLLLLSGNLVDCGIFDNVINSKANADEHTFIVKNRFEINNHKLSTIGTFIKRQDAKEFNELEKMYASVNQTITRFIFNTEIEVRRCIDSENEFSPYLSNNRIQKYKIIIDVEGEEGIIQDCNGYIAFDFIDDFDNTHSEIEPHKLSWSKIPYLYKKNNKNVQNEQNLKFGNFNNYKCSCTFNGLAISNVFAYEMKPFIKNVIPNILSITRIISNQYNGINYIAPLRNVPERTYLINKNVESVGVNGENAPILLAKYKKQLITTDMYCPWTNKYEINENGYVTAKLEQIVQQWLNYFELGKLDILGDKSGTVSLRLNDQNIVDVGFGASQILPIIIQGIFMDKEQTLLIEQPEIHLHPKMELQMADFLIAIAETGRNVIIETHSDHIKNRLLRRIIEDDSRSLQKNINMFFIKQETQGIAKSIPIIIDDEYGIQEIPDGFFDQAANEQLELMKAGILKREKIREHMI